AVAGGYRSTLDTSGEDFHLSDQVRSQAHRFFAALRMTCELTSVAMYSILIVSQFDVGAALRRILAR
ncbi:MAG: hypothetical protein ACLQOO_33355, partial [Terriglobia bacterium]